MKAPDAGLPHWGDSGYRLAVYDNSHHMSHATVLVVKVVRHTATQVVVERPDGCELRFYREDGRPVGYRESGSSSVLRHLDDPQVQDALAVSALKLLVTKLDKLRTPGHRDTNKTIRTRSQVLAAMREMRREIALAWDKMGANRDDLD